MAPPRSRLFCCSGVRGAPPRPPPRPAAAGCIQNPVGDELHAARLVAVHRRLARRSSVRHLQDIHGQHRLNHDVGVRVLRQRRDSRCRTIGRRPCKAFRWREAPGSACADPDRAAASRVSAASSAPSPSSVHSAWKRASRFFEVAHQRLQRRHDRLVLLQHEQLLRRVAPPAVGMRQMRDQLRRRFVQHARPRPVARDAVVGQPPDPAVPGRPCPADTA